MVIAPHTQVFVTQDGLLSNLVCKPLTEIFDDSYHQVGAPSIDRLPLKRHLNLILPRFSSDNQGGNVKNNVSTPDQRGS